MFLGVWAVLDSIAADSTGEPYGVLLELQEQPSSISWYSFVDFPSSSWAMQERHQAQFSPETDTSVPHLLYRRSWIEALKECIPGRLVDTSVEISTVGTLTIEILKAH
jgi:hypothetical protein